MRPLWRQVAQAIAAAHERGILLGDLSFTNVMVTDDDTTVKIIDLEAAVEEGVDPQLGVYTLGISSPRTDRAPGPPTGRTTTTPSARSCSARSWSSTTSSVTTGRRSNGSSPRWPPTWRCRPSWSSLIARPHRRNGHRVARPGAGAQADRRAAFDAAQRTPLARARRRPPRTRYAPRSTRWSPRSPATSSRHRRSARATTGSSPPTSASSRPTRCRSRSARPACSWRCIGSTRRRTTWWPGPCARTRPAPPTRPVSTSGRPASPGSLAELGHVDAATVLLARARAHPLLWTGPDVLHGSAGYGLACLRLWQLTEPNDQLAAAREIGERLARTCTRDSLGVRWPHAGVPIPSSRPESGTRTAPAASPCSCSTCTTRPARSPATSSAGPRWTSTSRRAPDQRSRPGLSPIRATATDADEPAAASAQLLGRGHRRRDDRRAALPRLSP